MGGITLRAPAIPCQICGHRTLKVRSEAWFDGKKGEHVYENYRGCEICNKIFAYEGKEV